MVVAVRQLSETDLVRVLTEPRNAVTKQYQALFAMSDVRRADEGRGRAGVRADAGRGEGRGEGRAGAGQGASAGAWAGVG